MSLYSADCLYFDAVPPLQFAGSAAIRRNFVRWFDEYKGAIGLETRDLDISASGDVAWARMLHRHSGTMKDGQERAIWVRSMVCCRQSNHKWWITHEHISLPVDLKSRKAAPDLVP
jgi:ketosteroid isomerase-like protein